MFLVRAISCQEGGALIGCPPQTVTHGRFQAWLARKTEAAELVVVVRADGLAAQALTRGQAFVLTCVRAARAARIFPLVVVEHRVGVSAPWAVHPAADGSFLLWRSCRTRFGACLLGRQHLPQLDHIAHWGLDHTTGDARCGPGQDYLGDFSFRVPPTCLDAGCSRGANDAGAGVHGDAPFRKPSAWRRRALAAATQSQYVQIRRVQSSEDGNCSREAAGTRACSAAVKARRGPPAEHRAGHCFVCEEDLPFGAADFAPSRLRCREAREFVALRAMSRTVAHGARLRLVATA
jgi:hypothetical protein